MALRDQPYLPLYVQDFMTDEKLSECSANATGVFIRIMCVMHKSEEYGTILLKQKDKQNSSNSINFANKLTKFLPYHVDDILSAITELVDENVLHIDGDKMSQKRMVKDFAISEERSKAGKNGYVAKAKNEAKTKKFAKAKPQANSENETVIENESKSKDEFKNENSGDSALVEILVLPFNSQRFVDIWGQWKKYKTDQHKFTYKSKYTEQASINELIGKSGGVEDVAIQVILQSIANGWKGFFELKNTTHGNSNNNSGANAGNKQAILEAFSVPRGTF